MYLLFQTNYKTLAYGTYTADGDVVYEDAIALGEWSPRAVNNLFRLHLLPKLRGHGKVLTKIGLVVPYADNTYTTSQIANGKLLKKLSSTPLRTRFIQPTELVFMQVSKAWPHLPIYLLFDTHLSAHLTRDVMLPPFDYDTSKAINCVPTLLHSYGHKANLRNAQAKGLAVSLYIGDQTSLALFDDDKLCDAIVSFSPTGSMLGIHNAGAFDSGYFIELLTRKNLRETSHLLLDKSGLQSMTETRYSFEDLLRIAGLEPKGGKFDYDDLSIESLEWIELTVRNYIRTLRHGIGALRSYSPEVKTLIVNTSLLPETNGLWKKLVTSGLSDMKVIFQAQSLLQAASNDLEHTPKG